MPAATPRPRGHVHSNKGAARPPQARSARPARCQAACERARAGSATASHGVVAGHDQDPGTGIGVGGHGLGSRKLIGRQPAARREVRPGRIEPEDGDPTVELPQPWESQGRHEGAESALEPAGTQRSPGRPIVVARHNRYPGGIGEQPCQQSRGVAKFGGQGGGRQVASNENVIRS